MAMGRTYRRWVRITANYYELLQQITVVNIADGIWHREEEKYENDDYEHPHNLHCSVVVMFHRIDFQCTSIEEVRREDYDTWNDR